MVFYTNDLSGTPSQRVLSGSSPEAIDLCHGLAPIRRWTGEQNLHRKILSVPAAIAVWAMDLSLIKAFCLMKKIAPAECKHLSLREFKRRVAEQMTATHFRQVRRKHQAAPQRETVQAIVGADTSQHILTPNSTKHSKAKLTCYLCSLRGLPKMSKYGCTACLRGYHVECFAAFHYRNAFTSESLTIRSALDELIAASDGTATGRARLCVVIRVRCVLIQTGN